MMRMWTMSMVVLALVILESTLAIMRQYDAVVTVRQKTMVHRRRRDTGTWMDFQETMKFSFDLEGQTYDLTLQKHPHMTGDTILSDHTGQTYEHDHARRCGMYQDMEHHASMIVDCPNYNSDCTLEGTFRDADGDRWQIEQHGGDDYRSHRLKRSEDTSGRRYSRASVTVNQILADLERNQGIDPSTITVLKEPEAVETKERKKRMLNPPTPAPSTPSPPPTTPAPTPPPPIKVDGNITGCNIVEIKVIADHTLWDTFLALSSDNAGEANTLLMKYFGIVYLDADMHFCHVNEVKPGTCIRLMLVEVLIQKTQAVSWPFLYTSTPFIHYGGADFLEGLNGLMGCKQAQLNAIDNGGTRNWDLCHCATEYNIAFYIEPDTNTYYDHYKGLGFIGCLCESNLIQWALAILEINPEHNSGDHAAAEVGTNLGADVDVKLKANDASCEDNGNVMALYRLNDYSNWRNEYWFTECSLTKICNTIDDLSENCLLDHNFTQQEYDDFVNQPLPTQFNASIQCQIAYGETSGFCNPWGELNEFPDNMCSKGVGCITYDAYGNELCDCTARVLVGTECGVNKWCIKGKCEGPGVPCNPENVTIGGNCTGVNQCIDLNTECDLDSQTCECIEGYVEVNEECIPKTLLYGNCQDTGCCITPNAECNIMYGICVCEHGFYSYNYTCLRQICLGDSCSDNSPDECKDGNAECTKTGTTYDSTLTCRCKYGYQQDITGKCVAAIPLDGGCSDTSVCKDPNAVCESYVCVCQSGYNNNNGVCVPLLCLGKPCDNNDQCFGYPDGSIVCDVTCQCAPGYVVNPDNGLCVPKTELGDSCSFDDQCYDDYSYCKLYYGYFYNCACIPGYVINIYGYCAKEKCFGEDCDDYSPCTEGLDCSTTTSTCVCRDGEYPNEIGTCTPGVSLGGDCTGWFEECGDVNTECDMLSQTCVCMEDFVPFNGMCIPKTLLDENCLNTQCCITPNAECNNYDTCVCEHGFYSNDDQCHRQKCLGEDCDHNVEDVCKDGFAECSRTNTSYDSTYTCRCKSGYQEDVTGKCVLAIPNGNSCLDTSQCEDTNAECPAGDCVCKGGFYYSYYTNDVCEPLLCLGEDCYDNDSCFGYPDGNVVCTDTCQCANGYVVDPNGKCVLKAELDEYCYFDDQCKVDFAYCDGGNTCSCISGYTSDNGECVEESCLGEDCNATIPCVDGLNCSATTYTCVCPDGQQISDDGTCIPAVPLGGQCDNNEECVDDFATCNNVCVCSGGFFRNVDDACTPLLCLGEQCGSDDQCAGHPGANITCDGTCRCVVNHVADPSGDCVLKVDLDEPCYFDGQCADVNANCCGGGPICSCIDGYKNINGSCYKEKCFGEDCDDEYCPCVEGLVCSEATDTCVCCDGHFPGKDGSCIPDSVNYGDDCVGNSCQGSDQVCGEDCQCECNPDYSVWNDTCELCLVPNLYPCENVPTCALNDNCADPNAVCSAPCIDCLPICNCPEDYYNNPGEGLNGCGECVPRPCKGQSCVKPANPCDDKCKNSTCRGGPNNSRCKGNRKLNESCDDADDCEEDRAIRSTNGTCQCDTPYSAMMGRCI